MGEALENAFIISFFMTALELVVYLAWDTAFKFYDSALVVLFTFLIQLAVFLALFKNTEMLEEGSKG